MLALFENPFFVREYRLVWRRPLTPVHWVFVSLAVVGVMLLLLLPDGAVSPKPKLLASPSSPWWLLFPHFVTCVVAAGTSARHTIGCGDAGRPRDLELLVPLEPVDWVLGKMVYPAVLTTIVWAAPIPLLLVAGVFDVVRRQELVEWVAGPLLAAISSIPASFLSYDRQPVRSETTADRSVPADRFNRWLSDLVRGWLWVAWFVTGILIVFRPVRQLYWLGLPVPVGLPFGLCCLAGMLCGWCAAEMTYLRTRSAERRFQRGACCASMVLFFIPWGLFRGWIHWPLWTFVLFAVPAVTAFIGLRIARGPRMKQDRRRLSALARRELEWFDRNCPGALLQLDLTRALRARSPAAAFVSGIGVIAAVAVPAVVAAVSQPSLVSFTRFIVGVISIRSLGTAIPVVSTLWANDREAGFLDSLFLTPQSSEELIAGRVAAAAGSHGVNVLAISGALGVFIGWGVGWHGGLPLWVSLVAPSAVVVAWLAAGFNGTEARQAFYRPEDMPILLLTFVVAPAALFAAIAGYDGWLPPAGIWACRLVILMVTLAVARWLFRCRVAELDRLRGGHE